MERNQVVQLVDEVVEGLLEGGPGSGRYPAGSGKDPTPKDNVGAGGGKLPRFPTSIGPSKYTQQVQTLSKNVMRWERSGSKLAGPGHAQAAKLHRRGVEYASEDYSRGDRAKVIAYHNAAAVYHQEREKALKK